VKFSDYQARSRATAIYPDIDNNFLYPVLGLLGESGEVAEKIKKTFRDHGGKVDDERIAEIGKEMGDVLWYLAQLATELGLSLADIAEQNLNKLQSRHARGAISGSGDNR
jgi:NTP pyrophosphatase (non-canonical NTP hydrolase)